MTALKRITKELKEFDSFLKESGSIYDHRIISINIKENILDFEVCFLGPIDSPYEEIINIISIRIPQEYPNRPPIMLFCNKIFHPNIAQNGAICLDILKDKWTPVYTIRTIIMSIISLLSDPNPDSPLNCDAARLYKESLSSKEARRKYIKKINS
jgi:ubiquitin-protein ligase